MRSLNCSSRSLSSSLFSSSTDLSRIHSLSSHHRPFNKRGLYRKLCCRKLQTPLWPSPQKHPLLHRAHARLDLGYPVLNVTLTFTLTNLERLTRNGLVGENPNPNLSATLNVARHCSTSSLDLTGGDPSTARRFQTRIRRSSPCFHALRGRGYGPFASLRNFVRFGCSMLQSPTSLAGRLRDVGSWPSSSPP